MKPEYAHIQILPIDKQPADWTEPKAWPSEGLFRPADDAGWLVMVTKDSVAVLYSGLPAGSIINDQSGAADGINEALLLKVIAAASRAEVLKGA